MAKDAPPPEVDLDLDAIRPPGRTFRFKGDVYTLPSLLPLPSIIAAIQIQDKQREIVGRIGKLLDQVRAAREAGDDEQLAKANEAYNDAETEHARALSELYGVVMDLLRDEDPDLPDLRLNTDELQYVVSLAMGSQDPTRGLEAAVAEGLGETSEEESPTPQQGADAAAKAPAAKPRSRSRKPSPARS